MIQRRPRRLLSVAHSYVVALNRRLVNEMARLGAGTWEVTAVAPDAAHEVVPMLARFERRRIPVETDPAESCRLEVTPAHFTRRIHFMLYGRRLRHLLREPWDLVHCWEEPYIFAGGQVAWSLPRPTPLVFATFQNIRKWYPPPFSWIERFAMKRATGWIAFGETIDHCLSPQPLYGARPRRVIPLGVDVEHFRPDPAAGANVRRGLGWEADGPPVVGFLGSFLPKKGLRLLTEVLDQLPVPWRALLVGSGPLEGELQEWSRRHGDRARVVSSVKHSQVPAYLNAMDVLCAPSQSTPGWREQLGRMLIEAFACGVPVVASDSGEIPHVVRDAGMIVGEQDQGEWVRALADLLDNSGKRAELAARGLERARSVYAWPIIARQHLEFFDELLDRPATENC